MTERSDEWLEEKDWNGAKHFIFLRSQARLQ